MGLKKAGVPFKGFVLDKHAGLHPLSPFTTGDDPVVHDYQKPVFRGLPSDNDFRNLKDVRNTGRKGFD